MNMIKNMNKKAILILVAAFILIGVAAGGYIYWSKWKTAKTGTESLEEAGGVVEEMIGSATKGVMPSIQTNPLEDKPDINPADKSNPYKNIKVNPFE